MSRRRKILVGVCIAVVALGAVGLWALPHALRRAAVDRLAALSGRATSIEDIDLNLFTGRFAVTRLRMARRPGHGPEAFVEFERLEGQVAPLALFRSEIRLVELRLSRPAVRITRTGPFNFDVSDLLQLFVRPVTKEEEPSRWIVTLGRFELTDGTVVVDDAFMAPPQQWRMEGLGFEASGLSTAEKAAPGHLKVGARLGAARLDVASQSVRLTPFSVSLDVSLKDFDLARVRAYVPPDTPAAPEAGKLSLALKLERVRAGEALAESSVSGEIRLDGLSVVQRDRSDAFLRLGRLTVVLKRMDFLGQQIEVAGIDAEGLDLKAARDKNGDIDLLAALRPSAPAETPAAVDEQPAGPPATTDKPTDAPGGGPVKPGEADRAAPAPLTESPAAPRAPPEPVKFRKVVVHRVTLRSGVITATDDAVSPGRQWRIDDLTVDGAGLGTSPDEAPGSLQVRAQLSAAPGSAKPARLAVDATGVRLVPLAASARITVDGLSLATVEPYWPETLPAVAPEGMVGASLTVGIAQGDAGLSRATASGSARIDGLGVVRRGEQPSFLKIPKVVVGIKQADMVARSVDLGTVEIEGTILKVRRDQAGRIDLLAMLSGAEPVAEELKARTGLAGQTGPPPRPVLQSPGTGGWRLTLERLAFSKGTLTFEDRAVDPATTLTLGDVKVTAERISWPFTRPGTFSFLVSMPGAGWTYGKGTAMLEPLNVQVSLSTRDTPIDQYQTYLPFPARLGGTFNGDSVSEIQRGPQGELILASRGTAWANLMQVTAPGDKDPVVSVNAMVIRGVDFSWPNYALVEKVTIARPRVLVERDEQGGINLRKLFEVPEREAEPPSAEGAPPRAPGAPPAPRESTPGAPAPAADTDAGDGGLMQQIVIDFNEIEIRDGFARFVDRTLSPPFTEDISRLSLKLSDLSNVLGRPQRTTMTAQGLIGMDGALDMRGHLSGIGETLRGDLIAELRDFSLPTANPYTENLTSWVVQSGRLQAKIHYQIEGDRITAQHEVELKGLRVEKARESDEAKQRIGIPLGLAVALLKDSRGDIDLTLPISGTLSDRTFNWADAMWAAVKQVVAKVVLSPFRAIGRLFTGGDDTVDKLEIDPVTFSPGSAVIAPSLEAQITKVADFMKQSPYIKVTLAPVITAADADNLKGREVRRRLETFRREHSLPDLESALRLYYQQRLPDAALPKTTEEQLTLLVEREPMPEQGLAELGTRRAESVRDSLVKGRGIAADRVVVSQAAPPAHVAGGDAQGRVEFTIVAAEG